MNTPRKPAAFRLDSVPEPAGKSKAEDGARKPRALARAVVTQAEIDVFDEIDAASAVPPPPTPPKRRSWFGRLFVGAFGVLVSLAIGLWTDQLIRDLFNRAEWLGWVAAGAAALAVAALAVILLREMLAISRLGSVEKLRGRALDAVLRDDPALGRSVVDDLVQFVAARPETAAGRRALGELKHDIIDGADLVRIAETEILMPLDAKAKVMILDAAKRVSVVTAVSPRALVDLVYVLFESGRLIRRLSQLYGGRPGTLGFFRLTRGVLAHLAVTGAIAAGDDIVHQLVGQGLAAKLSAKLGEGVVNGMMTARIGVAAMDVARPLPFIAARRPGMADFLAALSSFSGRSTGTEAPADK